MIPYLQYLLSSKVYNSVQVSRASIHQYINTSRAVSVILEQTISSNNWFNTYLSWAGVLFFNKLMNFSAFEIKYDSFWDYPECIGIISLKGLTLGN